MPSIFLNFFGDIGSIPFTQKNALNTKVWCKNNQGLTQRQSRHLPRYPVLLGARHFSNVSNYEPFQTRNNPNFEGKYFLNTGLDDRSFWHCTKCDKKWYEIVNIQECHRKKIQKHLKVTRDLYICFCLGSPDGLRTALGIKMFKYLCWI